MSQKPRRKQKPKSGKVIRVSKDMGAFLTKEKKAGETWDLALRRLLGSEPKGAISVPHMWVLPSHLIATRSEALAISLEEAVKTRKGFGDRETPIKVFSR